MPLKSILSVGLDPPTKSDKKGKDRAREKGMKGGKEERRRAERSEGKGQDLSQCTGADFCRKRVDENSKVNKKTGRAQRGRFFVSA